MQTDHCANEGEFFEEGAPNAGCGVKIQGLRKVTYIQLSCTCIHRHVHILYLSFKPIQ